MADLTAIILTRNEADNLAACLDSLAGFAARMVVVDSGSTDGTVAIARAHGAEVVEHAFTYYAAQFNWAIGHIGAETEWLLRIDADERFTPALCSECETLLREAPDGVNGVSMEAEYYFLGRLLRHGGSKRRKIMIFRRGHGGIEDRKRDAHTVLDGRRLCPHQAAVHPLRLQGSRGLYRPLQLVCHPGGTGLSGVSKRRGRDGQHRRGAAAHAPEKIRPVLPGADVFARLAVVCLQICVLRRLLDGVPRPRPITFWNVTGIASWSTRGCMNGACAAAAMTC